MISKYSQPVLHTGIYEFNDNEMEWNRISLITLFEMYTIRSDSPRSRRCIDFIFDPAVLQSKDEPTSIFDAKMKDRNHDINRTIGVSKIFNCQFKFLITIVPSENAVIDGKIHLWNSNENKIIFVPIFEANSFLTYGGYADYNQDDFLGISSVRINLPIVSETRTNNNVFHEAYFNHSMVLNYNTDTTACPTTYSVPSSALQRRVFSYVRPSNKISF